jgi:DNA-directed RNA polymerase specialized sigma24 family protein
MDLASLAARCREETENFRRRLPSDPAFCLQLWRRALLGSMVDEREAAWGYVYTQYAPQVADWFEHHELAPSVQHYGAKEDFTQQVFYQVARANKKQALRTDSLAEILSYVRTCLVNEILMARRRRQAPVIPPSEFKPWDDLEDPNEDDPQKWLVDEEKKREIWQRFCACAIDVAGQNTSNQKLYVRVIDLRWLQGYMPAEIIDKFRDEFPRDEFPDAGTIHRILAKVKACYKRRYGPDR